MALLCAKLRGHSCASAYLWCLSSTCVCLLIKVTLSCVCTDVHHIPTPQFACIVNLSWRTNLDRKSSLFVYKSDSSIFISMHVLQSCLNFLREHCIPCNWINQWMCHVFNKLGGTAHYLTFTGKKKSGSVTSDYLVSLRICSSED